MCRYCEISRLAVRRHFDDGMPMAETEMHYFDSGAGNEPGSRGEYTVKYATMVSVSTPSRVAKFL
jgi:hypothetical protein